MTNNLYASLLRTAGSSSSRRVAGECMKKLDAFMERSGEAGRRGRGWGRVMAGATVVVSGWGGSVHWGAGWGLGIAHGQGFTGLHSCIRRFSLRCTVP